MWAFALTLAAALPPLAEAPRPDGPVKDALAQVIISSGQVVITPEGKRGFGASSGTRLRANDTIAVGSRAWVVLGLVNGHAVRLDDDLSLRVDQLALLKAPPPSASLKQQFDKLVTEKEQDAAGRLIGWNASQTGANVPSSVEEVSRTGGGGNVKNNPAPPTPKSKDFESMKTEPKPTRPRDEQSAPPPPTTPAELPRPDPVATAPAKPPAPGSIGASGLSADATLTSCIVSTLAPLGAEVKKQLGTKIIVRAKLRADGTLLVQLPLGLNTSACAAAWFSGKPGLSQQWSDVTVTVP